jgi:MYXO-CTERM domain-containing protein
MTPTCVCDHGYVAFGSFASDGTRSTQCEQPMTSVPDTFYGQRLPDLPMDLPGGKVTTKMPDSKLPVITPSMDDLGSKGMPVPHTTSGGAGGTSGSGGKSGSGASAGHDAGAGTDMGPATLAHKPTNTSSSSSDCSVARVGAATHGGTHALLAWLGLLGVAWLHRRRAR